MVIKRFTIILLFTVISLTGATQFVAFRLGHQAALGRPLVLNRQVRIYWPWSVLGWYWRFGDRHPQVFGDALIVPLVGMLAIASAKSVKRRPRVKEMGRDSWGNLGDMKKAGLLDGEGAVIGRVGRRVLKYDLRRGHMLLVGATRAGKSVGVIIPSMLDWPESIVVFDPKRELWNLTSGYRSKFSHCLFFNPTRLDSIKYNPLLEVRRECEVRDAQNIATVLADPAGENNTAQFWDISATQLITALILHVLYTADDDQKHLGTVRDLLLDFENTCIEMMTTPHLLDPKTGEPTVHPEVMLVANGLYSAAHRLRSSVVSTASSYLTLYADPIVRDNTSHSDIAIGDLMCSKAPVTLYIQAVPSDAERLRSLIRMMLNQIPRSLMEDEKHDAQGRLKRHELLMVMEEFSSHGRLPFFEKNLRQMASYGLRTILVVQSFSDLMQNYGAHQSLVDNCGLIIGFSASDTATLTRFSQMAGTAVEFREGFSQSQSLTDSRKGTVNLNEAVRPLLDPGDVRQFSIDDQLVFATGNKPLKTRKVKYYELPFFKKRLLEAPDQSKQVDLPQDHVENRWLGERAKGPRLPFEPDSEDSPAPPPISDLELDAVDEPETDAVLEDRFYI